MLLVAVGAIGAASLVRPRGLVAFVLAVGLLGFAEIVAVSHVLSFFDAYERRWLLTTLAGVAVAVAAAVAVVRPPWPSLRRGAVVHHLLGDPLLVALGAVVFLELGYVVALALFTPPTEYDVLTYHLTRAILWIQRESIGHVAGVTDTRINDFPPDAEIAQGATIMLSGSLRWIGTVQIAALLTAVLACYGIALRLGFERRQSAFGALLVPTLPVVAMQAPTALNDLVVASLVAAAVFFALGRTRVDLTLACLAVALLVGTKPTAFLAAPVVLAVALLAQRGRRLAALLVGLVAAGAAGAAWYAGNASEGSGALGSAGESAGTDDWLLPIVARTTRYAVEAIEIPGAHGRDRYLYVVIALAVGTAIWLVRRRWSAVAVGACLVAIPFLVPEIERVLHGVYWHGWELVGFPEATGYAAIRDTTVASNLRSWYGPLGVALPAIVLVVATRRAARRDLPWVAVVLVASPFVMLVGSAAATGYHTFSGRYLMGGVVLSAATWGIVRTWPACAAATVAVAATTVLLSLVNYGERPSGIDLLESASQRSIWTLPREWAQNIKPELAHVTWYLDRHATPGTTIALTRDRVVYPAVYVGYPTVEHRIAYADTLAEATRTGAAWAVLPLAVTCAPGWVAAYRSPPWGVFRRAPGAVCTAG